jgi:hypothetical protein
MAQDIRPSPRITFAAGAVGDWNIDRIVPVVGEPLIGGLRLAILPGGAEPGTCDWKLAGALSHTRYTTAGEARRLAPVQLPLGLKDARCAALIPIRKSDAWWSLAQDERREIYEERSRHTTIGLEYVSRIARRLHHSRDLGESFDFLTWFEFAPEHETAFGELLGRLRASEEWRYVDREFEVRLTR